MRANLALAVALSVTWLVWSFHFTPLFYFFGAVSVLLVLLVVHRMRILDEEGDPTWLVSLRGAAYLPWLVLEIVKSNLHVAAAILKPSKIAPRLVTVPAEQKTAIGRVLYANSITLTPGTVSVVVDEEERTILVHALTEVTASGLETGEMGRRVARLEP